MILLLLFPPYILFPPFLNNMFKYLLQKEWIQIRRNTFVMRLILLFPVIIMCVAPWITSMEVREIGVCVVDNDRSTLSRQLIQRLEVSPHFRFRGLSPSYPHALQSMEQGETDLILVIPPHFARHLVNRKAVPLLIAANAVNGTKGNIGAAYLTNIIATTQLANDPLPPPTLQKITTHRLYNRHESYKVNMIPALMAMVMVMMCGFLPALNIVGEKETGTIEQINVTPVRKSRFILAKLLPYWCIALIDFTLCLFLAWLVYGITPVGNITLLYLFAILLAVVFSSIGLIVSNYSQSLQQAMLVMWFVMVCLMLLSGLFTPVRSMPHWAQMLTYVDPIRHYIDAARSIFIRGTHLSGLFLPLSILTVMGTAMASWAVWSYKKNG